MIQPVIKATMPASVAAPARERCPACAARKLIPRKGWPAVLWCFGCGANFDRTTKTPICPANGPAALTLDGEIIDPFTPTAPAVRSCPPSSTPRRTGSDE